jgi:hypothetical protein
MQMAQATSELAVRAYTMVVAIISTVLISRLVLIAVMINSACLMIFAFIIIAKIPN